MIFCWHKFGKWTSYVTGWGHTRERRVCEKCGHTSDRFIAGDHDPSQAQREGKQRVKESAA